MAETSLSSSREDLRGEDLEFLSAYAKTGRKGAKLHAEAHPDAPADEFKRLPLLLGQDLHDLAFRALEQALGPAVSDSTPFPCMIWYGGARDVEATEWSHGGHRFTGTIADFVEHVLRARSHEVAVKRGGWVIEPTSNVDGRRTNESTTAMHAVFLDCDGAGGWDTLLSALNRLGLAHIAYESGGATATVPKWRIVLPLASPIPVRNETERTTWKRAYHACRVVFGTIGKLLGPGFDPATDPPAIPWFVTERRRAEDPPRRVLWRPGRALDLAALISALPEIPVDEPEAPGGPGEHCEGGPLDENRHEEIVTALANATREVHRDRRALYLSLPGVLLDRGLDPDDVRAICSDVSASYPRPDAEKHRDNCHSAETTIGRWERGDPVTQIGTLNDLWPEVAKALDRVLPNPAEEEARAAVERLRVQATAKRTTQPSSTAKVVALPPATDGGQFLEGPHRRRLGALASKKLKSGRLDDQIRGVMLRALLHGEDLIPRMPSGEAALLGGKPVTRERAIAIVMGMVAYKLPVGTPFDAGLSEIARKSIHAMLREKEGERVRDVMEEAERAFLRALGKKIKSDEKHAKDVADAQAYSRNFALHGRSR